MPASHSVRELTWSIAVQVNGELFMVVASAAPGKGQLVRLLCLALHSVLYNGLHLSLSFGVLCPFVNEACCDANTQLTRGSSTVSSIPLSMQT
jgi:hypothetical protein